jgi:hypothetical protein
MKLRRNLGGNCMKAKGDCQDWVHLDQTVLMIVTRGGKTEVSGQKMLKAKLSLKGDYQAQVHLGQMVLMAVMHGGWTVWTEAKTDAQMRVRKLI